MEPLFDRECRLVGWLNPLHEDIFDAGLNWVAYLYRGDAWSVERGNWIGHVEGAVCRDTAGRVVTWNSEHPPTPGPRLDRPYRPYRPDTPFRPAEPRKPARPFKPDPPEPPGWSPLTFHDWLSQ